MPGSTWHAFQLCAAAACHLTLSASWMHDKSMRKTVRVGGTIACTLCRKTLLLHHALCLATGHHSTWQREGCTYLCWRHCCRT